MEKLLICFLLFSFQFSNAQKWDSLGSGFPYISIFNANVEALGVYNGTLYVGGPISLIKSGACIVSWNGSTWSAVGEDIFEDYYPRGSGCNNRPNVAALMSFNGNLFAGGYFDSIQTGYANAVAQWNGISWDSVKDGVSGASKGSPGCIDVTSFAIYQGELFMGGYFQYTGNGTKVNYIARWNGTSWNPIGSGLNGGVNCLAVYNGNLYAGGSFTIAGGIAAKNIAMWNGTNWTGVGGGINNWVGALCVYNGALYAGGGFDSADTQKANSIVSWNGLTWSPLGSGTLPLNNNGNGYGVFALTTYGPDLCVGGGFNTAGGIPANNIALWNGSTWNALGSGASGNIYALTVYNGALVAGGSFDSAGGIQVNSIAEWISPLGINKLQIDNGEVSIYPNPSNALFTIQATGNNGLLSVNVYNVLGENVLIESAKGALNTIDLSTQPNGVYFYRVLDENSNLIGEGKLVIAK